MTLTHWAVLSTLTCLLVACSTDKTATSTFGPSATLKPDQPRVEYRTAPLGIDDPHPRFSWVVTAKDPARRGQKQSAYQLRVTSGGAEVWNTGKVASDATAQIAYAGPALASNTDYFWAVKVWDTAGNGSPWSTPQRFSTGLLKASDWSAQWIGYDAPWQDKAGADESLSLAKGSWIWHAEGDPVKEAPEGTRYFRKTFTLPKTSIRRATLIVSADNNAQAFVNGHAAGTAADFKKAYAANANWMLKPGEANVIAIEAKNGGGPAALAAKLTVEFEQGERLVLWADDTWQSSTEATDKWKDAAAQVNWQPAKVIAKIGDAPWGTPGSNQPILPPAPYLRTTFTLDKPVKRAMAYATALGVYELRLNGRKVGDYELTPGWQDYRHRVYYNTYDVTRQLRQGKNGVGVMLGDGWYAGYLGYHFKRENYNGEPRARVQIHVEFEDGSTQTVVTDDTWRATYGPIREADLLMGTTYDARLESQVKGFDTANFDDSKWDKVVTGVVGPSASVPVQAYVGDPTTRHESIKPKKITEPTPGTYVFDLGQNMVGWAKFKLKGKAGRTLTFRYAEMLNPDGTLYTTALRAARATDAYTPAADGTFEWEPPFTFHGFQYVEIAGLDEKPGLDAVTGVVIHADMKRTGYLETSNPLVNQLVHNIVWGQKGNYLEVPTDCPQRDERLGWTGDAQFFIRTGAYNYDIGAFFNKWLIDLVQDSQLKNGGFTHVAPAIDPNDGGATAWQDAAVICTYAMYKFYGDTRNIERHWPNLQKFMQHLHDTSKDLVRNEKPFGDWLHQGASAKGEVMGTAYYAYVARLMSEMAAAIGKTEDARTYGELADRVREKFQKEFVKPDGTILESSQTGFALAFTMDLIPADIRRAAAEQFREEVRKRGWHLGTGFIGTPRLLPGLQAAGLTDVAYKLLLQESFPGWLFQVKLGATTMWERWDGYRPDKGFQDPGMNSFNHYAFGSVGEWMYASMAGIDQQTTGFRNVVIRPRPGGGFTFVNGRYESISGPVVSHWNVDGKQFKLHVEIPVNSTATVYVPGPGAVTESGRPAETAPGVRFLKQDGDAMVYQVDSGSYDFASTYTPPPLPN